MPIDFDPSSKPPLLIDDLPGVRPDAPPPEPDTFPVPSDTFAQNQKADSYQLISPHQGASEQRFDSSVGADRVLSGIAQQLGLDSNSSFKEICTQIDTALSSTPQAAIDTLTALVNFLAQHASPIANRVLDYVESALSVKLRPPTDSSVDQLHAQIGKEFGHRLSIPFVQGEGTSNLDEILQDGVCHALSLRVAKGFVEGKPDQDLMADRILPSDRFDQASYLLQLQLPRIAEAGQTMSGASTADSDRMRAIRDMSLPVQANDFGEQALKRHGLVGGDKFGFSGRSGSSQDDQNWARARRALDGLGDSDARKNSNSTALVGYTGHVTALQRLEDGSYRYYEPEFGLFHLRDTSEAIQLFKSLRDYYGQIHQTQGQFELWRLS